MNERERLRPEVEELLRLTDLLGWIEPIREIARALPDHVLPATDKLIELDRQIPDLGQHNVNERTANGGLTGVYRVEDRPIFRGIQYVGMRLHDQDVEWLSRNIVTESCYQVEGSLKRATGIKGPLSVGMILKKVGRRAPLDLGSMTALSYLNESIYNNAKHTIEQVNMDGHMFSVADALAVYLACRVLGSRLLAGSGITTKYGEAVFEG